MLPKFMMMLIIINGANWFFISHLCSFLMWSCSLLPLPILAIQTLASSLYLCFPLAVPSPRPFSPSESCYPVVSTVVPDFTEM